MNKLDELFEKKLSGHVMDPLPGTWDKVEARLSKKNNTIWIRWAAIFILGCVLAGMLWLGKNEASSPLVIEPEPVQPAADETIKKEMPPPAPIAAKEVTIKKPVQKKSQEVKQLNPEPIQEQLPEIQEQVAVTQVAPEEVKNAKVKPMVLTYTLESIASDESEHNEEEAVAVAEKKDNSFKKVMKIASDAKNSESPLGGLREMKHDLFALDLKKSSNKKH